VCLSILVCILSAPAFAARTTRDLVFDDDEDTNKQTESSALKNQDKQEKPDGTQTIAVNTTMLLTRDGRADTVLPSHAFKSGDRVKLVYTPSIDGYVYWLAKGTSGEYSMIFPSDKAGTDNKVARNKEYTIPVKGAFRFDDKVGKEELLCVLSPDKLADMESAVSAASKSVADKAECKDESTVSKRTTRDLVFDDEDDSASKKDCVKKEGTRRTTRDLVFDDEDSDDVNTQKQTAAKDEPMVAHYVLEHQ
jgi:hypothetical protein